MVLSFFNYPYYYIIVINIPTMFVVIYKEEITTLYTVFPSILRKKTIRLCILRISISIKGDDI